MHMELYGGIPHATANNNGKEISKEEKKAKERFLAWRGLHLSKSKLANVVEMASFMAGFAVVATVELQIHERDNNPALLTAFVVTTSLLVATTMIALMLTTCILPYINAVEKVSVELDIESEIDRSPHHRMRNLIDMCWVLVSTVSLFLFTLDVILMSWIKFTYFSLTASIVATVIMTPVLVLILLFGYFFYRRVVQEQYRVCNTRVLELEELSKEVKRCSQKELEEGSNWKIGDEYYYELKLK